MNAGNTAAAEDKRANVRLVLAGIVIVAGLAAIVLVLDMVLDHYPVVEATSTAAAADRSTAVVAVLAPVIAGVVGVIGLYFGVSAAGSSRGQEAEVKKQEAKANEEQAKTTRQALQTAGEMDPDVFRRVMK